MGRALIADPELPNKGKAGRREDIRTCLRCNEGCSSRVPKGLTQRCAVNAEVGRERSMKIHPVSDRNRSVSSGEVRREWKRPASWP